MKRIGCFHAHYSNIEHIERALAPYEVELIHFVDPGLDRMKTDENFTHEIAERKVVETLDWIIKSHVDAILITCTFFTAVYREELHPFPVPIIKIDEPLFQAVCDRSKPALFVFTNPGTVEGTMKQFNWYAQNKGKLAQVEAKLLPNTFELFMQGKKEAYIEAVSKGLTLISSEYPDHFIVAAQLSMVPAAEKVERETGTMIGNSLESLSDDMSRMLSLAKA